MNTLFKSISKYTKNLNTLMKFDRNFTNLSITSHNTPNYSFTYTKKFKFSNVLLKKEREPDMFCYHCAQTSGGVYCDTVSTCGKTPEQSKLQALLLQFNQSISQLIDKLVEKDPNFNEDKDLLDHSSFLLETTFATLTNVNFDPSQSRNYLRKLTLIKDKLKSQCIENNIVDIYNIPLIDFVFKDENKYLTTEGRKYSVFSRFENDQNVDTFALRELLRYGLKGVSAYFNHAERVRFYSTKQAKEYSNKQRAEVFKGIRRAWVKMEQPGLSLEELFNECMLLGGLNFKVMELLYKAHTNLLGEPVRRIASSKPIPGHSLLVSGHDLADLKIVLEQTEGRGVNVYTHGEMAPAHSYPELFKYKHLVGNLGKAWYEQKFDFKNFKGAILMTSNCLMEPRTTYKNRIYSTNSVGWQGIQHIADDNYRPVVDCALREEPFTQEFINEHYKDTKDLLVGFGKNTFDEILAAIKKGELKNIFLIGGCDGAEEQRKYFTHLAEKTPKDSIILTLGCGKFRVNQLELGELGNTGIPRVLDLGQCNDSYSAIMVAAQLANELGTDVNSLPLHLAVSWFEQKAIAVLLTLLHLGIKNIRIGPIAPAFLSPGVVKVLQDKFNLQIAQPKDVEGDLKMMLSKK